MPLAYVGGNMETKNVKIIDEHGIDRNGNVICTLGVDGKEYVLYSIERDLDNDNLFISLLTKNNDGTSNMVNIEDSMEKNAISDIAKQVITFSVNNESDKTTGNVKLANGKEVTIGTALFNKEQSINVTKTYITTVKKSVTKVSENFYKIENVQPSAPLNVFEPVVEAPEVPTQPVESVVEKVPESVEPILPTANPEVVNPVTPEPSESAVEPILPVMPIAPEPVVPEAPIPVETPKVEPILPPVNSEPVVIQESPSVPEPVAPTVIEPILPVNEPVIPAAPTTSDNSGLVIDGSKETNLNAALGEMTSDATLPVQDVSPIREFGQDQVLPSANVANVPPTVNLEPTSPVPPVANSGFANNKFFTVIAILLFVGACVFLGYEAFRYFSLVK